MEKKNYTSDQKYFQIKLCTKHFHRLDPYIFLFLQVGVRNRKAAQAFCLVDFGQRLQWKQFTLGIKRVKKKKNFKIWCRTYRYIPFKLEQPPITVISPMDLFCRIIFHRGAGRGKKSTGCQQLVQNLLSNRLRGTSFKLNIETLLKKEKSKIIVFLLQCCQQRNRKLLINVSVQPFENPVTLHVIAM